MTSAFFIHKISNYIGLVISIFTMVIHEYLLHSGISEWIFDDANRQGFISANKEWFISLPFYSSVYIVGGFIGAKFIFNRK